MENWKVKIVDVGYKFELDIYIVRHLTNGKIEIWRNDVTETIDEYGAVLKPSFSMHPEMLQDLVNSLSERGIKPKEGFLEGKLTATEKHLEDMRTLVFKDLSITSK